MAMSSAHVAAPPSRIGWLLALIPAAVFVGFAARIPAVAGGAVPRATLPWVPSLGISLSFAVDGLGMLFALLISGIGTSIVVYAGGYLAGHPQLARFYVLLALFTAAMLGLVCAGDLITLFVCWELTSVSSYLLIGFDHERAAARDAALQALLVTGAGGLALLAGALLLRQVGGSFDLDTLAAQQALIRSHPLYTPILLLVLAAAFTKSAQVPFHFWLPGAMQAPTPVSAYLHSATMVNAGVFLVARLQPVLGGSALWHYLIPLVGTATMLTGAVLAIGQHDLKRLLAYSTVSALGTLMLLLGLGTALSTKAAMVFLVVHSLYKGALFMVAGAVDHETGTRDITRLGGLWRAMPLLAAAAVLAGVSMAGLPPVLGFIGKELLYEAKLQAPTAALWITAAGVLTNALMVAVAGLVVIRPFFGAAGDGQRQTHEPPAALWAGPLVLAVVGFVLGMFPDQFGKALIGPAVSAVHAEPTVVALALWHGFNPVLALSALTIASGVLAYLVARGDGPARLAGRLATRPLPTPSAAYRGALAGLKMIAAAQTRILQSGSLSVYLLITSVVLVATVGATVTGDIAAQGRWQIASIPWRQVVPDVLVVGVMIVATFAAVSSPSRLGAIAALGVVGYAISLLFVFFGAPDLAMTQFAIETLTVILFVLVLYRLPPFTHYSSVRERRRDAVVAAAVGLLMAMLTLGAMQAPVRSRLSAFFAAHSLVSAHGRNVVNVILVDFRALDTLGEITVLAAAALGVFALRRSAPAPRPDATPRRLAPSLLFTGAAHRLFPLLLLFSIFLLLRGHNAPGGGFVGGLVAAAAFALHLLAFGVASTRRVLRADPRSLIGAGLLLAGASGLVGLALGASFLSGVWGGVAPVVGKLGTPLCFDVGVYLVVLGVVLLMLFALSED
jgi:multicomponent Na+:H+ antiporter subunit A